MDVSSFRYFWELGVGTVSNDSFPDSWCNSIGFGGDFLCLLILLTGSIGTPSGTLSISGMCLLFLELLPLPLLLVLLFSLESPFPSVSSLENVVGIDPLGELGQLVFSAFGKERKLVVAFLLLGVVWVDEKESERCRSFEFPSAE